MLRVTPFLTAMLLFTWLFLSPQSIATEVEWSIEAHQPHFADINGDGVQDMLLQANTSAQTSSLVLGEGVAAGVGYTVDNQRPLPAQLSTAVVNTAKLTLADFNGDGLADVLVFTPAQQILTLYFSQPTGFSPGIDYTVAELEWLADAVNYDLKAGDFNGDGHQDLLAVAAKKHSHYLMHSNAVGQLAVVQAIKKNVKWGQNKAEKLLIADYNGDGRADVFALSKKKHKKHHVIYADGSGLLDTKHAEARDLDDWDADTHSVIVAGTVAGTADLLRLHNATGGVDENDIALAQDACEPNCSHQVYTVKTATTASFTALTSVPSTPTTAPGPIGSSYIAINSSYAINMPSVQGATIYQLYESAHNSTSLPADSSYQRISFGSSTTIFRSTPSVGYRWFKYQACNAAGCSGFSPLRRIYLYGTPGIPNNLSISATSVNVGTPFSVSWTPASGSVDGTVYSVYQAYNGNESVVYSVTRKHWSESRYSYSTAQYVGGSFRYRVQACSPGVGCGGSVVVNQTVIAPNTAPVANTDYASVNEDSVVYIDTKANDTDAQGDALTVATYGAAAHGSISVINNTIRYAPAANFHGSDSFSYRARDTSGWYSQPAVVYVTVNAVNDAPTGSVVISGQASVGQTLTASASLNDVDGMGALSYQWYRQGAAIAGATGTRYLVNVNDAGSTLTVSARYRDGGGTDEQVNSAATAVVMNAVSDWQQLGPVVVADSTVTAPVLAAVDLRAATVKGGAGVSGGQARYQIPIDLPPGRKGIQPSVSVTYSSQGGNGIVGHGWSLNAGGAISRCGPTYAQDGLSQSVTFTADDRFCLNGQRLMVTALGYGQVGATYRTEMDSFVVVTQTAAGFSVARPDGSTATYETPFSPEGIAGVLTWKLTSESWSGGKNTIDYVYSETTAGEHLLSTIYYTGSDGSLGDRTVQFEYETRTDARESYLAGGKIVSRQRLKAINTLVGERTISRYKLAYSQSQASQRSLLASVQRCGSYDAVTQCTPLSTFEWSDSLNYAAPVPLRFGGQAIYDGVLDINDITPYGDVDGDGSVDFPGYMVNAEQGIVGTNSLSVNDTCRRTAAVARRDCAQADIDLDGKIDPFNYHHDYLHIDYSSDNVAGYVKTHIAMAPRTSTTDIGDRVLALRDINGDGWPDVMVYRHHPGRTAQLEAFTHSGNVNTPYAASGVIIHSYTDFKDGSNARTVTENLSFAGDFDGNGLPDLLVTYQGGTILSAMPMGQPRALLLNRSTPSGLVFASVDAPTSPVSSGNSGFAFFSYFIDINGDGLTDVLGLQDGLLSVRVNLGNGSFKAWQVLSGGVTLASLTVQVAIGGDGETESFQYPKYHQSLHNVDINHDGINELLVPGERLITGCTAGYQGNDRCGDRIYTGSTPVVDAQSYDDSVYRYDAIYFELQADGTYGARRAATDIIASATQLAFIDAFGDGHLDVIFNYGPRINNSIENPQSAMLGSHYGAYIVRNYGSGSGSGSGDYAAVDYLTGVTNGIGHRSQWRYKPLSSATNSAGQAFYQTDHDYQGEGYIHFASSLYAVQAFGQSDGIGGLSNTEYAYEGAMYHLQGRGFTGFRTLVQKDTARNKITTSVFEQKFPRVSQLLSQSTTVVDSTGQDRTTIATLTNTWADNPQHSISNVAHWLNSQSVQSRFDLAGNALSQTTQTVALSRVDTWGNIGKTTTTVTDYLGDEQQNRYQTVRETTFIPDVEKGWVNKFSQVKTTTSVLQRGWIDDPRQTIGDSQWQLLTVNKWHTSHQVPSKTTLTASGSSCARVDETVFNDYGLATSVSQTGQSHTCAALSARTTQFSYATAGYWPTTVTNAKAHVTSFSYDSGFGVATQVTAPNNLVTQTTLDAIGRPLSVTSSGLPTQYSRYLLASDGSHAPTHAVLMTRAQSAGTPIHESYNDSLGRPLRGAVAGFDGSYQYADKSYDNLGHLLKASQPYTAGLTPYTTTFGGFDSLDRPTWRTLPHGLRSDYAYDGLTTNITVGSDARAMSRTYSSAGWLLATSDAQQGTNRFSYDGAGRPLIIEDANGNQIVASYNGFGHKTQVDDPNQGLTTFGYSTLGELVSQTANGVTQTFSQDTLGRTTTRTTTGGHASGTATFTWDTAKTGLLSSEAENGITRTYSYTNQLQLSQLSVNVDGTTRTIKHQYDSVLGRPKALEYPNGLTLEYRYNDQGYLTHTRNAVSHYTYREVTAMADTGQITGAKLANNLMAQTSHFNRNAGTMSYTTVDKGAATLHGHHYNLSGSYDEYLNLRKESNSLTGLQKAYDYDNLNRLTQYTVSNTAPAVNLSVNYAYDAVGNLLKKSDYSANRSGAYQYGGSANCPAANKAGPNALCRLEKLNSTIVQFSYDGRGNLINGDGLTLTYNALDKPLTIIGRGPGNNTNTAFTYGSDGMRAKQTRTVSGNTTTTYYVDKLFEMDNDGSWRAYIDDIAVLSWTPEQQHKLLYTLRDRLGSATTLVNQDGQVTSRRYFDPFGRTSSASGSEHLSNTQFGDWLETNRYRRGFTDHEHLNEQQLIHMNGRVYDYNLGRFMSVDPLIQAPTSTQSINPYSYIMNNPLAGTDPTGYCATTDNAQDCVGGIEDGESTPVTDEDGKTVGHIGKDENGNIYLTSNGSDGGQSSLNKSLQDGFSHFKIVPIKTRGGSKGRKAPFRSKQSDTPLENVGISLDMAADLTPIVGDVKGIIEAIDDPTIVNVTAATIGMFPVVGDFSAATLKGTKNIRNTVEGGGKIPWGSWGDYKKVTVNGQEYAVVGDRLYSRHAVNRMQPGRRRHSSRGQTGGKPEIYLAGANGDFGRGVAPQFIENAISSAKPITQQNGNISYSSGSLQVITNQQGAVVTVITH